MLPVSNHDAVETFKSALAFGIMCLHLTGHIGRKQIAQAEATKIRQRFPVSAWHRLEVKEDRKPFP